MAKVLDVCAVSTRGMREGEMLRWVTNRRGQYVLHTVVESTGRRLKWDETKRTINQICIRDRGEALHLLLSGRYATRMRSDPDDSPSLIAPGKILLELDDGTVVSLNEATNVTAG